MPPSQPVLPANRAFLVQFRTPPPGGLSSYAGRVEHVVSGQMARFHSLEELLVFMMGVLSEVQEQTVFNVGGNRVRLVALCIIIAVACIFAQYSRMPNMAQRLGRSEADMTNPDVIALTAHWGELAKTIFVPHTEAEYQQLVTFLDRLIDEVGEDETHPLASLMELVGTLNERYEDEHVSELTSEI